MGMAGTQHDTVHEALHRNIIGIASAALNEARILETRHRLPQRIITHGISSRFCFLDFVF